MSELLCAVCLYVRFLDAEGDRQPGKVSPAATTVEGTAVCELHLEDLVHVDHYGHTRTVGQAGQSITRIWKVLKSEVRDV